MILRINTSYLTVFSPNAEIYGPEKTLYLDTFHTVRIKKYILYCLFLDTTCLRAPVESTQGSSLLKCGI